jgi:CP family cyanate transporter-like MFS transporter
VSSVPLTDAENPVAVASRERARAVPWVVAGIVLIALTLRGPIVAPAPVIRAIQADTGLSTTVAGLLTSLPVLLFGLGAPVGAQLIRRAGPQMGVLVCLVGVLIGTLVRSAGGTAALLAGTIVIGSAVAIGNVVIPVVIRDGVPLRQVAAVTGAYAAALNVGSMITSLGTAPLAGVIGWRWAILTWGLLTLAGLVFWFGWVRTRIASRPVVAAAGPAAAGPVRMSSIGWLLTLAFCGQAMGYYAVTAWLPSLLADERGLGATAAGSTASLFQVAAIVGAFGTSALLRRAPQWVSAAVLGVLWLSLPIGLMIAPGAYAVWAVLGGVAQGGGFTAIFTIVGRMSRSDAEAATLSARIQTVGYLAAAAGPPLAGALHSASGGWTAPLLLVLLATATFTVASVTASVRAARLQEA